MSGQKAILQEEFQTLELLLDEVDACYGALARLLKEMSPILKKNIFNEDDQLLLRESLNIFHQELDHFTQLLRRGEGEWTLLQDEMGRLKEELPQAKMEYEVAEAQLWSLEKSLKIREKCLNHLNELYQLLSGVSKLGEMTEFDERLLTEIAMELKNLGEDS